jgi:L-fuculose-phosphate aldolase
MSDLTGIHDVRFKIAAARRILYREGCDSGVAGHVSMRAPGEDAFWVTPFGYFDETLPSHVIKVDFNLNLLEGSWRPSPAIEFHEAIYEARPDVNSVVHTHSKWVIVLSTTHKKLGMYDAASVFFHDDHAVYKGGGAAGKDLVPALGKNRALILVNHGSINVSDSLENATIEAIVLEKSAKYQVHAMQIGGQEIPLAEVLRGREAYFKYGYRTEMWNANMRRLRKSDPELFEAAGIPADAVDMLVAQTA